MKLPRGHKYTPYGTPAHVTELVVALLKAAFSDMGVDEYPWRYVNDYSATNIVVDTVFNKDSEVAGVKPSLIVSRGQMNSQPISLSDKASESLTMATRRNTALVTSSIEVKVIAKSSHEADMLAQEVFNIFLMCRDMFYKMFNIHYADYPAVTPASPIEQDDRLYYCVVMIPYRMQYFYRKLKNHQIIEDQNVTYHYDENNTGPISISPGYDPDHIVVSVENPIIIIIRDIEASVGDNNTIIFDCADYPTEAAVGDYVYVHEADQTCAISSVDPDNCMITLGCVVEVPVGSTVVVDVIHPIGDFYLDEDDFYVDEDGNIVINLPSEIGEADIVIDYNRIVPNNLLSSISHFINDQLAFTTEG